MACPYLKYRRSDGNGTRFDHERAYCGIQGAFVSPMIADVCNDRDAFDHTTHCDVFRRHESGRGTEHAQHG